MTTPRPPLGTPHWDALIAAVVEHLGRGARVPETGVDGRAGTLPRRAVDWRNRAEELVGSAACRTGRVPAARGVHRSEEPERTRGRNRPMDVIRLAAAEEALKKNGLRGHVYMTRSAVVWFATKADEANRGIRTSAGPGPLIDAIKRAGESEAETTDWLESLAGDRTRRERTPAEAVWNSPYLVVTGTPAKVALAGVLARPATVGPEKLRRLLQEAGTQTSRRRTRRSAEQRGGPWERRRAQRSQQHWERHPGAVTSRGWRTGWQRRGRPEKATASNGWPSW